MPKVTGKEAEEMAHEIAVETIGEIMEIIGSKMKDMEDKGLSPHYGFYLSKMCGFAVAGSSLAFFDDAGKVEAGQDILMEFGKYMAQSIALNKGMGDAPKSKIILQ